MIRTAQNSLDNARDSANKAERAAYDFLMGAAEQAAGQFGSDSDEYASGGDKKKSEYKRATRKERGQCSRPNSTGGLMKPPQIASAAAFLSSFHRCQKALSG